MAQERGTTAPAATPAAGESTAPATSTDILPPQHWTQLAEDLDEDSDSTWGDSASSTASINSSILHYRTLHGRTYHSDHVGNAQYWGTNDGQQQEALDIAHHFHTLLLDGKSHLAPLDKDKVQAVLDVGTGTGIWAIDFADEFPNARVIGTDISPIQPGWVPPNLQFQIDDCTQEWTFAPDTFDYVHIRWLVGSIVDWTALYKEAFRALKPGGYLEDAEPSPYLESDDGTVHDKSAMSQWGKFFVEGGKKIGRSFTIVEDGVQRKAMEEAGFVDIQEIDSRIALGGWPKNPKDKEIGRYSQYALEQDIEGTVLFMANLLGWTKAEVGVYIAHLRRELRSGKFHAYYRQKTVIGRKPLQPSAAE
ncbi:hypothetical protein VTK73DRAFT_9734 [Phialemonium thermophilum]|uniref:Methyltransferase n=1 Tax=Phialemonium thermophilum TaxID=223376 RepID=A0ABR3W0T4_9PEZI